MRSREQLSRVISVKMAKLEQEYERVKNDPTIPENRKNEMLGSLTSDLALLDMEADERLYHKRSLWPQDEF